MIDTRGGGVNVLSKLWSRLSNIKWYTQHGELTLPLAHYSNHVVKLILQLISYLLSMK